MLEYILIRPHERTLVQQATKELRFLAMDELHVYRGRQGADVAMLMRRLRQRAGNPSLQFIGTSATLVSKGSREARRGRIAEAASTLFGVPVPARNVVDETLRRMAAVPAPATQAELRAAVDMDPPLATLDSVSSHPLAAWIEETFGIRTEDGRLVRQEPVTFEQGLRSLVEKTGLEEGFCRERLKAVLEAGNAVRTPSGDPYFAFRLHQFLSSGGSVFATIERENRHLTTEGQYVAPSADGEGSRKLLYPLAFCRDCGQEYYLVSLVQAGGESRLEPRSPLLNASEEDSPGTHGFFSIETGDLWTEDEDLPESWFELRKGGPRPKEPYAAHIPRRAWAMPDGTFRFEEMTGAVEGWFQPRPLMLCLRCRASYDLREKSDFRKLATLSQTGRSTSTTIVVASAVTAMEREMAAELPGKADPSACKVLSFTDNRQDASLQAGHLNDFVQVVMLRGALVKALARAQSLTFDRLGPAIFDALSLRPSQFMRDAVEGGPGYESARKVMVDLLEYRAFEDLRRAWRVAQPNLEQCGLLRIEYDGLSDLARDESLWAQAGPMASASPERRQAVLQAVLNHLRSELVLDADCLTDARTDQLRKRSKQWLREPWSIDENERLRRASVALLPGASPPPDRNRKLDLVGLGYRSAIGRYLRSRHTWESGADLSATEAEELVRAIVAGLRGHILAVLRWEGEEYGVQIISGAIRWLPGDGMAPGPDPVRSRSLYLRRQEELRTKPNSYFELLYRDRAALLAGLTGHEHTGQVKVDDRIEREEAFRKGEMKSLFCSPTMELGVDIADLSVVHLRNVPPTPANYARRSGRAGRGGKPALVVAFCSQGNAHDQYFFRRKDRMIAGAVAPPQMDLTNQELVRAHLHSAWLSHVGLKLGDSIADLLDLALPDYPIIAEKASALQLSPARQKEVVAEFRKVIGSSADPIMRAPWYSDEWLEQTVQRAPDEFDAAFRRWRDLYQSATEQLAEARRKIDTPRLPRQEREAAEQREREAKRERELLLNQAGYSESDFYPYRYLANEGFLPGYNFPRLPLRALVAARDEVHSIERARFLGLTEFGPHNVVYHEGQRHRVTSLVVPAGGLESRISRARLCRECGYAHPGDSALVDCCEYCGTRLDDATSDLLLALLDQPAVRTSRWTRITSDEEERSREGYHVTTHYQFAPRSAVTRMELRAEGQHGALMEVVYAPQATLWRINHGWRRAKSRNGFALDRETGRWGVREDDPVVDGETPEVVVRRPLTGVRPFVADVRNILLLRPLPGAPVQEKFLVTLVYALQRGIQSVYQVEEQEVAVELIGKGAQTRLLPWEAAEGGTGVWERMLADRYSFSEVAREALKICHFEATAGQAEDGWGKRCSMACYDCLLSYSNQLLHSQIDRHLVRDYLVQLSHAGLLAGSGGRSYEEQYQWLLERIDPASGAERRFLHYLRERRHRLPDQAQHRPEPEVPAQPDFYYQRDGLRGVCVFVDGPPHDAPHQAAHDREVREALEDLGYKVVVIRHDRPFKEQVERYSSVFGLAQ